MGSVWILEEYCGSLDDLHSTNFVGAYKTKELAMAARNRHSKDLESSGKYLCIDGYCLTKLEIQDIGEVQFCYMTEEV